MSQQNNCVKQRRQTLLTRSSARLCFLMFFASRSWFGDREARIHTCVSRIYWCYIVWSVASNCQNLSGEFVVVVEVGQPLVVCHMTGRQKIDHPSANKYPSCQNQISNLSGCSCLVCAVTCAKCRMITYLTSVKLKSQSVSLRTKIAI